MAPKRFITKDTYEKLTTVRQIQRQDGLFSTVLDPLKREVYRDGTS